MPKIWGNMKKYVENKKEYLYYIDSGTWINAESSPLFKLRDLETFQEKPRGKNQKTWNMILIF